MAESWFAPMFTDEQCCICGFTGPEMKPAPEEMRTEEITDNGERGFVCQDEKACQERYDKKTEEEGWLY